MGEKDGWAYIRGGGYIWNCLNVSNLKGLYTWAYNRTGGGL